MSRKKRKDLGPIRCKMPRVFFLSSSLAAPSPAFWRRQSLPPTRFAERLRNSLIATPAFVCPTRGKRRLGHRRRLQKGVRLLQYISFTSVSDLRHFETKPDLHVSSTILEIRYLQKIRFFKFCLLIIHCRCIYIKGIKSLRSYKTVDIKDF